MLDTAAPRVYYQLGSLPDRAVDQGVLPHLLVAAALGRREKETFLLPGVAIQDFDDAIFEVDVFGTTGGLLLAGEVKTSGASFTEEQVRTDVRHSMALGVDVHLMACVDEMPVAATRLASDLCSPSGMRVQVLDRTELRPLLEARSGG